MKLRCPQLIIAGLFVLLPLSSDAEATEINTCSPGYEQSNNNGFTVRGNCETTVITNNHYYYGHSSEDVHNNREERQQIAPANSNSDHSSLINLEPRQLPALSTQPQRESIPFAVTKNG